MILLGLGGNLPNPEHGSPRRTLAAALAALVGAGTVILGRSRWYESEPVPPSPQPLYVNSVAALASERDPAALLRLMQQVERQFGRVRGAPNAARIVDLDLLDYDGRLVETGFLTLPHPRLHLRRFVLVPLAEVAPAWRHPRLGLTAAELLARLPQGQHIRRLPPGPDDPATL